MSDIFISYASQDRARAQVLAGELERQKWSVWWDRKTPPGRPFAEWIEEALNEAKCVIVLWSKASVKSQWVQNEADTGARQNILVPALIDDVGIPFEFRRIQAANLVDWDQRVPHSEFDLLLDAVSAIIGKPVLIRQLESTVDEQEPANVIPGERKDTPKEEGLESALEKDLLPDPDETIDRKRENEKTVGKFVKVLPAILMFAVLAVTAFLAISIHRSNLRQQKQAQQLWSQAEPLALNGDYEKAIEIADTLLDEYPGSKYAQQAPAKKAAWQEALAKKRITELLSQAQTFKEQDEFDNAIEAVAQVLVLDPENAQAKSLRTELTNEKQAQQLWSEAEPLALNGDYEKAIEIADTLLDEYPDSKYAQDAQAKKAAWQKTDVEEKRVAQIAFQLSQAQKFKEQDEFDNALEAFAQVLVLDPNNAQAKSLRTELTNEKQAKQLWSEAETLASDGDYEKAIEIADTLLDEYSGSKYAEQASAKKAAWQEALAEKTREQDFKRFSEAGTTYMSEEIWKKAIESFTKAREIKPNDVSIVDNLATCQHNLYLSQAQETESKGDLEAAISLYKKALSYKNVVSTQKRLDSAVTTFQAEKDVLRRPENAKAPLDYASLNHRLVLDLKGDAYVKDACFSPTGDRIASADRGLVRIWDATRGTPLHTLESYTGESKAVCFSGDGKLVASGGEWEKVIEVWDSHTGECLLAFDTEHSKDLTDICFSPDGRFIVSASDDKILKKWDVASGLFVRAFEGHSRGVYSVAFSPDGTRIASGSCDKTIKLWDAESGNLLKTLTGHTSTVESLAFSPDGDYIAACEYWENKLMIWDVEADSAMVNAFLPRARCVEFSPTGHYVVSGDAYGQVHILSVESGEWVKMIKSHDGSFSGFVDINAVGFSPDGKRLLVAADNEYLKVFLFE